MISNLTPPIYQGAYGENCLVDPDTPLRHAIEMMVRRARACREGGEIFELRCSRDMTVLAWRSNPDMFKRWSRFSDLGSPIFRDQGDSYLLGVYWKDPGR